ncbi:MAG TPA: histidine kinase [Streptosporangiaceae bacterium]|nr:histidine kinase [Streptosporangiaceae bacterium]
MTAVYAWLRRHRVLVDSALAVSLGLMSVGTLIHRSWNAVLIVLLMIVPVAFRRRAPVAAFAIAVIAGAWQVLGLGGPVSTSGISTGRGGPLPSDVALLVLLYTVAAYRPRRYSIPALLTCIGGSLIAVLVWLPVPGQVGLPERLFVASFLFGGISFACWVLGDSMRYRRGYYAALEDKAARLEAERHAEAKVAAAAERARIARELHDVVAHHVSVMVVQADGAGYVLRSDPDRAAAALAAVSATGRQALTELRRLLGVLRSTDQHADLAPVPGLRELRELLDQARTAGLEVSYTVIGTPRDLPEGAELAAYRMVQESLTNTRKHAGLAATAAVLLQYETAGLILQVTDDGMAAPAGELGGHGLAGMRERIAMYGGTVTAGPLPGGGFRVRAWLPCPPAAGHAVGGGPEMHPVGEPAGQPAPAGQGARQAAAAATP